MRKHVVALAIIALALTASAASARSLGLPNELPNGSFEAGRQPWQTDGGYPVEQATQEPRDGQYVARSLTGYYSGGREPGHLYQCIVVPRGIYEVDLSGWVKRYVLGDGYALQPLWGWVEVQLTIDNIVVASQKWDADDAWHYFELRWTGLVECAKDVHIR